MWDPEMSVSNQSAPMKPSTCSVTGDDLDAAIAVVHFSLLLPAFTLASQFIPSRQYCIIKVKEDVRRQKQ
jgi:hypothetical protein